MFDVILVNYHCMDQVRKLVTQFESISALARIIVINNSRSDVDEWAHLDLSPKLICVSALRNTGYAGGNQLAFEILQEMDSNNHLCVLNADVDVPADIFDVGQTLFSDDASIGQICFRTENECGDFIYDALNLRGLLHEKRREHAGRIIESDYAAGSFFFLRNGAIADISCLFFEPYFLYWEEVDLSFRLRREHWKIVCCTDRSVVRHSNPPETEARSIYYIVRNAFLFADRNNLQNPRWAFFIFWYLMRSMRLAFNARSTSPISNFFAGLFDGMQRKGGQRQC